MSRNPFQPATPVAKKLKVLLYGASGSGKTLAALSFPRVALVDAEGGSDLYAGRPGIPAFSVMRTKSVVDLERTIEFIRQDNGQSFETLVIDPITVFYDVLKEATARTAKDQQLGFREWAKVNNRMTAVYNSLTSLPVHVVVVAREAIEYEGEGATLKKVGQKPDADKKLPYIFDFIVRMNADHSGSIVKSRGVDMQQNATVPHITWDVFATAAGMFSEGEQIAHQTDEEATELESADLRIKENATDFVKYWRGQGLTDSDILAALKVSRIGDYASGRKAADDAVTSYIEAQMTGKSA